jgi:hypothetical protein
MDEPRLKAKLRQATVRGHFGAVLRPGDADAGGILAVLRGHDGLAVLAQIRSADGQLAWLRATGATPVDQPAADAYVARQLGYDSDLWVVEFETAGLDLPFDGVFAEGSR